MVAVAMIMMMMMFAQQIYSIFWGWICTNNLSIPFPKPAHDKPEWNMKTVEPLHLNYTDRAYPVRFFSALIIMNVLSRSLSYATKQTNKNLSLFRKCSLDIHLSLGSCHQHCTLLFSFMNFSPGNGDVGVRVFTQAPFSSWNSTFFNK